MNIWKQNRLRLFLREVLVVALSHLLSARVKETCTLTAPVDPRPLKMRAFFGHSVLCLTVQAPQSSRDCASPPPRKAHPGFVST